MRRPDRPGPDDQRPHHQRHAESDEPVAGEGPRALARHRAGGDQTGDQEEQAHREQGGRDHHDRQRDVADPAELDLLDVLVGPGVLQVPVGQGAVAGDDHGDQQQLEIVEVRDSLAARGCVHATRARSVWTLRPRSLYDGLHKASSTRRFDRERRAGSVARQPNETAIQRARTTEARTPPAASSTQLRRHSRSREAHRRSSPPAKERAVAEAHNRAIDPDEQEPRPRPLLHDRHSAARRPTPAHHHHGRTPGTPAPREMRSATVRRLVRDGPEPAPRASPRARPACGPARARRPALRVPRPSPRARRGRPRRE